MRTFAPSPPIYRLSYLFRLVRAEKQCSVWTAREDGTTRTPALNLVDMVTCYPYGYEYV